MEKKAVISARNISIGYHKSRNRQENCLYENLSFDLYSGELVCLLGANGAGKSTLLRTISSTQAILNGNVTIEGKSLDTLSKKKLSKLLGLVLTDKTSIGGLTVRELVELGRYPYTGFFGQLTDEDKLITEKAMEDVGVLHKAECYCAELSDGELQKAMIGKALAQECPIILLDEPTAFLDITSRIEITYLLHELAIKHNKSILLSTHDIELALLLADRLWLLSSKYGLKSGVTEDIIVSGEMNNFFGNDKITFDIHTGNFLPDFTSDKSVYLKASGYLYHWTKNLLAKHGYKISETKKGTEFCIDVYEYNRIVVTKNEVVKEFSDFEALFIFISK